MLYIWSIQNSTNMEIFDLKSAKDTEGIKIELNVQQEWKLIGAKYVRPGHTLFEIDIETLEVKKVTAKSQVAISITGEIIKRHDAIFNPKVFYMPALNAKNALKAYKAGKFDRGTEEPKNTIKIW